jgi:hypothetical protein
MEIVNKEIKIYSKNLYWRIVFETERQGKIRDVTNLSILSSTEVQMPNNLADDPQS